MPDVTDLLRRSVDSAVGSFEPSADLSQRIAHRTLQLERRRRARIVGAAAAFAVAMLGTPLLLHTINSKSDDVTAGWTPVNVTAGKEKVDVTTTTAPASLWHFPNLSGIAALQANARRVALKKYLAAIKKNPAHPDLTGIDVEVLGATIARGPTPPKGTTTTTRPRTTTTTRPSTTTTTVRPPPTTLPPPPTTTTSTTTTTIPVVPLQIVAPDYVCADIPAYFAVTGTGADLVVWSNGQVGAIADFVFTDSTTITAQLDTGDTHNTLSYGVQVTPLGTPPC